MSRRTLVLLGISGGIVPCWDAIALLLFAVACRQVVLGLWLILAFSLGLSAVLVAIGLVTVTAKSILRYWTGEGFVIYCLSLGSAGFITLLGALLLWQALLRAPMMS